MDISTMTSAVMPGQFVLPLPGVINPVNISAPYLLYPCVAPSYPPDAMANVNRQVTIYPATTHVNPCQDDIAATEQLSFQGLSEQTRNLRSQLIVAVINFLAIQKESTVFPLLSGNFATVCSAHQHWCQDSENACAISTINADSLLHCAGMDVCVNSDDMFRNLSRIFDRFLHHEREKNSGITCISGYGRLGENMFHYLEDNTVFFVLRLINIGIPEGTLPCDCHQFYHSGADQPVPLKTSTAAILSWLQSKLSQVTPDLIFSELDRLTISENDAHLYSDLMACRPHWYPLDNDTSTPENTRTKSTVYDSGSFFKSRLVLKRDIDTLQDVGSTMAAEISHTLSPGTGKQAKSVRSKQRKSGKQRGKGRGTVTPENSREGTLSAPLFTDQDTIERLRYLTDLEASNTTIRHLFLKCPYLGKMQCLYLKKPAKGSQYSYLNLTRHIHQLLSRVITDLDASRSTGRDCYRLHKEALAVSLLLKYLVYEPPATMIPGLLHMVATYIDRCCQQYARLEAGSASHALRILPQAFVAVLASAKLENSEFNPELRIDIVNVLANIMGAANRHGCYDISAAIVSLLPQLQGSVLPDDPAEKYLPAQIHQFFHVLQVTLENMPEEGACLSGQGLSIARTITALADDLEKRPKSNHGPDSLTGKKSWVPPPVDGTDQVTMAINVAIKRLAKEQQDLKAEAQALANTTRQRQLEIRNQQADARGKKQQQAIISTRNSSKEPLPEEPEGVNATPACPQDRTNNDDSRGSESWEESLRLAALKYRNGQISEATEFRDQALTKTEKAMHRACIWADCANALLEQHREIIALELTLFSKCHQLRNRMASIKQRLELTPFAASTGGWLKPHEMPPEQAFIVLAENAPEPEQLQPAIDGLNSAIEMYLQAVTQMEQCSPEQLQDQGSFILDIMKSDLDELRQQESSVYFANSEIASVMAMRTDIMKRLGFYGSARGKVHHVDDHSLPGKKGAFREAYERCRKNADILKPVLSTAHHKTDKLTLLVGAMTDLGKSRS